jgi:hypothetical protein
MSDSAPDLRMLNIVVADRSASIDFYRRVGIVLPDGEDTTRVHVELRMAGGFSLELDTEHSARIWQAAWRTDPASVGVVVGFSLPTREAVDERYVELTAAATWGVSRPSTPSGESATRLWPIRTAMTSA